MKNIRFGKQDALIDYLIDGNVITGLEALLLFGVHNLTAVISKIRSKGYLLQRRQTYFVKVLIRVNKKFRVEVPDNLPINEIEVSEYWISK